MRYTNLKWSEDLLVSCSIDGIRAIFRSPIERLVNDQLEPNSLVTEILKLFSWGRSLNDKILTNKIESRLKLKEGYYDKEGQLLHEGRILRDSEILKQHLP